MYNLKSSNTYTVPKCPVFELNRMAYEFLASLQMQCKVWHDIREILNATNSVRYRGIDWTVWVRSCEDANRVRTLNSFLTVRY